MGVRFLDFGIYYVNVDYMKYLHDVDSEVYYSSTKRYDKKPFLGIVLGLSSCKYFIPFTSSKPKHKKLKSTDWDYYLITELVEVDKITKNMIWRPCDDDDTKVEHILSVLDIKKMIPVPDGLYVKPDIDKIANPVSKALLKKEQRFCRMKKRDGILKCATQIYEEQMATGKPRGFSCNFSKLETACSSYQINATPQTKP